MRPIPHRALGYLVCLISLSIQSPLASGNEGVCEAISEKGQTFTGTFARVNYPDTTRADVNYRQLLGDLEVEWATFVGSNGYAACNAANLNDRIAFYANQYGLDKRNSWSYRIVDWTPSQALVKRYPAATLSAAKDHVPKPNRRYLSLRRAKNSATWAGGATVTIYREDQANCTDEILETRHLDLGQEWLFDCSSALSSEVGGVCYAVEYDVKDPGTAPAQKVGVQCTKGKPSSTIL